MLGHWEVIVVLVVVLLIFGPAQLPKLAKGIGKSIRSFKQGMKEGVDDDEPPAPKQVPGEAEEKKELPKKSPDA